MTPKEEGLESLVSIWDPVNPWFRDVLNPTRILPYPVLDEWGENGHMGREIGYLLSFFY